MSNLLQDESDHFKSAIIGYWRSGASDVIIAQLMKITVHEVLVIINEYEINNTHEYQRNKNA